MAERRCVKCGGPLTHAGRGRPKAYCSVTCRRAAEYELRRVQRHLEACERRIRGLEETAAAGWYGTGERERKVIARLRDEELPQLEERLRDLLAAGAKTEPR